MNFRESELSSKFLQSLNQVLSDLEISNEVKILTDVKLEIVNVYSFIFDLALKYLNYEIYIEFKDISNLDFLRKVDFRFLNNSSETERIFLIVTRDKLYVFENKSTINLKINRQFFKKNQSEQYLSTKYGYFIVSRNPKALAYLIFSQIKSSSANEISQKLISRDIDIDNLINSFKERFVDTEFPFNQAESIIIENLCQVIRNDFYKKILFDEEFKTYQFKNEDSFLENFELNFFNALLKDVDKGYKFYRYSNLDLAFYLVNHGTLRFSGLSGMNDISEINYVEDYLGLERKPDIIQSLEYSNKLNSKYIMSTSMLNDDLNQWRLYGDDCKGVSIEFEMNENKNKNLYIKKVSYSKLIQNGLGQIYRHFELEALKNFIFAIKSVFNISFEFKSLDIWKHFFKSHEYEVEQEVRVLYIKDNNCRKNINWVLTYSHNILNPTIDFKYDELPFNINKVLFGSKAPEIGVNIRQFTYLASVNQMKFEFNKSSIKNYR